MHRNHTRSVSIVAILLCALWLPSAHASPGALIDFSVPRAVMGQAKPVITIIPRANLKSVKIALRSQDGRTLQLKTGRLKAGKRKNLSIKQPVGVSHWTADFSVVGAAGETADFQTTLKTIRVDKIKLSIGAGDVDMDARAMTFRITNPAARAELTILGEGGRELGTASTTYEDAAPGASLTLDWDPVASDIVRMDLRVTDVAGFYVGTQIIPFTIEIPHDEVVFASGKSVIRPSESPKLAVTLGHIQKALKTPGTLLQLKLFVAGYTDTVGGRESNLVLSRQRARAIAAWFRARGLKISIFYQGFGEDVLAKETPDNTDEPVNRRALYILSSQVPSGNQVPTKSWKKL